MKQKLEQIQKLLLKFKMMPHKKWMIHYQVDLLTRKVTVAKILLNNAKTKCLDAMDLT